MAAYSIEFTVYNLNSAQVECRRSVLVDRHDWAAALQKGVEAIIMDLPGLFPAQRNELWHRLEEIVPRDVLWSAAVETRGTEGQEGACSEGTVPLTKLEISIDPESDGGVQSVEPTRANSTRPDCH